jgi:hypothetical protein
MLDERIGNEGVCTAYRVHGCHFPIGRRPPSPESPQPYISFHRRTASLFPMTDDEILPLRIDGLPDYVRGFNQSNQSRLHIWSRTRGPAQLSNPVVVRFTIHNVLTAYVTLGYDYNNPALVVENITTFSPQEKVSSTEGPSLAPLSHHWSRNLHIPNRTTSCTRTSHNR